MNTPPTGFLETLVKENWGRLVAVLTRDLRDFQLAEDSLQDAIESAVEHWTRNGAPRVPAAWLLQTARRKAIDRLRRAANFRRKEPEITALMALDRETALEPDDMSIPDERLTLIFTCCHPALDEKSRVALTLRTIGGLTTGEIARAFLDSETTMAQRLVRAKQKIKLAGIPYQVPEAADLPERTHAVLNVIYLVFNEGYATSSGGDLIRLSLCDEAIRLARIIVQLRPDLSEARGLLALILLSAARMPARSDEQGHLAPLDEQDRSLWNAAKIAEGTAIISATLTPQSLGPYLIQGAISAVHCEAPNHEQTDWPQIVLLYDELLRLTPNPVVRLNRGIALSYARSPSIALDEMAQLESHLAAYQPYHAGLADILRRAGQTSEAIMAYKKAIALSTNTSERAFLEKRLEVINS
jgi:RNA polymerase sigma-70 factor, ECF subfamily